MKMTRYWINAPSTHQPDHPYHGARVIGPARITDEFVTVYPTTLDIISLQVSRLALSPGWKPAP